jgi:hypothetical protein
MKLGPGAGAFPELRYWVSLLNLVQLAQKRLHSGICFTKMVVGNGGEQMVYDMRANIVVKVLQKPIHSVDRFEVAAHIVPRTRRVPHGTGFCMVQKRDGKQPEAVDKVWNDIVYGEGPDAVDEPHTDQERKHGRPARNRECDHAAFFLGEELRGRDHV